MAVGPDGTDSLAEMASKSSRRRKRADHRHRPSGSADTDAPGTDAPDDAAPADPPTNGTSAATLVTSNVDEVTPASDGLDTHSDGDEASERRRWGLGDAIGGWAVAQVASILAVAAVVTLLGYPKVAGLGGVVGQAAGQTQVGSTLDLLTVYGQMPFVWQVLLQVPLWVGLAGAPILAARRKGTSLAVDFGFRFERNDIPIGLAIGVALQLVLVPLVYLPLRLLGGDTEEVSEPARTFIDSAVGPLGVVLLLLVVGLGAPVVEELFYRGLTQRALLNRMGRPVWAVVIAALFFALAHLQSLQFPALVAVGIVFGVLAQRSGRLGPAIFAHMGFNLTTAVVFLLDLRLPFT